MLLVEADRAGIPIEHAPVQPWAAAPLRFGGDRAQQQEADAAAALFGRYKQILEVQARLRALLRRAGGTASPVLVHGPVSLDPAARRVMIKGEPVVLSAREYALLHDLMSHKTHIRTRAQLEESLYAWGEEAESNTIEVYIHHLRKKLGTGLIRTVRGLGYQLGALDEGE